MSTLHLDLTTCPRCKASAHDHMETTPGRRGRSDTWLLACAFCGYLERIDAPATPASTAVEPSGTADTFRFSHGRFSGMTLAEADAQPNGREYLKWMLGNSKTLAPRIAEYLQQKGA